MRWQTKRQGQEPPVSFSTCLDTSASISWRTIRIALPYPEQAAS